MNLYDRLVLKSTKLSVIGLGYVGLPLASAFSEHFNVIGYDSSLRKVEELRKGIDINSQVSSEELKNSSLEITSDSNKLLEANFHIIAVPTPIYKSKKPDIRPLLKATKTLGKQLVKDSIVVYESTVYPGLIEEICIPLLEKTSGLKCIKDFHVGYSPERINPGDRTHTLLNTVKIVSAVDEESLETVAKVYGLIVKAGVYKASCIRVAEASKIIENCQRDINIAFMNEISILLNKLGIDTSEVLEAANTKWNFLNFTPGLVGGHCIAVDPYYLIDQCKRIGFKPRVMDSSRQVNEYMPMYIAEKAVEMLKNESCNIIGARILVMGITFKENCSDIRNSKAFDLVGAMGEIGAEVLVYDPVANEEDVLSEYGIKLSRYEELSNVDSIIVAVAHDEFARLQPNQIKSKFGRGKRPIVIDVKGIYDKKQLTDQGFLYWRL